MGEEIISEAMEVEEMVSQAGLTLDQVGRPLDMRTWFSVKLFSARMRQTHLT